MKFENIFGHEAVRKQFDELVKNKRFPHAIMLCGEDGIGKSIVAKEIAAKLLNKTEIKEYADLIEWKILNDKKSISVDQVRKIIEEVNKKPYEGNNKLIVVHDMDYMTIQGQNAFLKTIEEPPLGVYIILLCQSQGRVLDTVRSRCQIYKLNRLDEHEMRKFISGTYNVTNEDEMRTLLAFSDGIPGKVDDFLNDKSLKEIRNMVINAILNIKKLNPKDIVDAANQLSEYKKLWREICNYFVLYIRDALVYKETGNKELLINLDKIEDIKKIASQFSMKQLNRMVEAVNYGQSNLETNVNMPLTYVEMLFKIQEV
ncbi:DNA polymerase-3 subunit delta' [Clostridium acetobutylicum]|uniref:DNA polymerase III subunit delta' n=1 Tax=Clostridium acetobutylicum (strain ATCC 824 / DSM 792 / JCM 1419 / IAM 19013 / LMG 5710 / NBRC 13948 / NRRL B-527 / VKM B-1787 / 2291 / W) TaxID=272562 RepID=Q97M98_CLOAB|nr:MULTISPECIES: DNA polymerase III subunit delta' [Clostridium]AAK78281.1 DNA-polymerase III, gamma subunit [Clostridium acetobutylicum ATCC 824]ADZ19348.1 DNA polymerase III subunit delta [Clostridium acetobutylicum EA 2018]AEI34724.1 DNA polymerase III subunit delta' [Clostridium acetobutylicum DSM 1731]AWV80007.1 AAA family ATPase [Clostridium acetobutylicum]MBC2395823.1 DNA polymerase III subunit delta' [Clostridium acetobutylicum]